MKMGPIIVSQTKNLLYLEFLYKKSTNSKIFKSLLFLVKKIFCSFLFESANSFLELFGWKKYPS
jgi:hypothetical protein